MLYTKLFHPKPAEKVCAPLPLHYFDSAQLLQRLQAEGHTKADISRLTGLTTQQVADRLRLMELDEGLRIYLRRAAAPERIAFSLLSLPDEVSRRRAASRIVRERLCIRDSVLLIASVRRKCSWQRRERLEQHSGRILLAIRDIRPYHNAVRAIAGQMQAAGVRADFTEKRKDGRVELTITYPVRRRRTERRQSM